MTTLKQKKPIQSTPEPEIHNSGPVEHKAAKIQQALDKYAETGSIADYNAWIAAKEG